MLDFYLYPTHTSLAISSEANSFKSQPKYEDKMEAKDQWKYLEDIANVIDYLPFLSIEKNESLTEINKIVDDFRKIVKHLMIFQKK